MELFYGDKWAKGPGSKIVRIKQTVSLWAEYDLKLQAIKAGINKPYCIKPIRKQSTDG